MSLGDAIARAAKEKRGLPQGMVGKIQSVSYSTSSNEGEVQLMIGSSPDLIPVPLAGWSSTFLDRVKASGRGLIGRRVGVMLVDGQPLIIDTWGV